MICEYEQRILARIYFGDMPDEPGAAWSAACEALSGHGMVKGGKVTEKGRGELLSAHVREPET